MPAHHRLVATAAAGTEDLLAGELSALGLPPIHRSRGAVEFQGSLQDALRACLSLRTAMRVLLPIARVPAAGPDSLYASLRALPWQDHLDLRRTFAIEVAGRTEGLDHSLFAAQKAKDAIADALRERLGARPDVDVRDPDVRIVLHLWRGQADVSLDVAGESLHRRGWRARTHRASLRETLAAAVLLGSGFTADRPFIDPMCGAGTIAIEAALLVAGRAPNVFRRFGAERWPAFGEADRRALATLREEARARVRRDGPPIFASDRDPEAVEAARQNARRAGVEIRFSVADARLLAPLDPPGLVASNPPYGGHEGGGGGLKQLKSFYHALGARLRQLSGHTLALLAGSPAFESAFGLRPVSRRALFNGPLPVTLLVYRIP